MHLSTFILLLFQTNVFCQQFLNPTDDPCFYNASISVRNVANCLQRVKTAASDSRQFWFGETWKSTCLNPPRAVSDWIKCYNPTSLQRFTNLGSRLLRVVYFNKDFLRNLDLFPEVTFVSPPGKYNGCDHTFGLESRQVTEARPLMSPVPPWVTRLQPEIKWPGQDVDTFYTIAILDVGFGYINYLAYNYPFDTTVVKEYVGPNNFREESTPYAVVVFRQPVGRMASIQYHNSMENDSTFNIQTFMIDNQFQQSLVGLNWVTVGTDAYAIQLQKDKNLVDNCPALIRNRLYSPLPGRSLPFLSQSHLHNIDTWMTVQYNYAETRFSVCCKDVFTSAGQIRLDPIGDGEVNPVQSRDPPIISVSQSLPPDMYNYRRTSREFVALMDSSLYTIMLLTTDTMDERQSTDELPLLHWLVTNLPGNSLQAFTDGAAGETILDYRGPLPAEPGLKSKFVFILLQQSSGPVQNYQSTLYSPPSCPEAVTGRCRFNILEFMARNGLKVKGVNWMLTRADHYVLWNLQKLSGSTPRSEQMICTKFGMKYERICKHKPLADFSRKLDPPLASSFEFRPKLSIFSKLLLTISLCFVYFGLR